METVGSGYGPNAYQIMDRTLKDLLVGAAIATAILLSTKAASSFDILLRAREGLHPVGRVLTE